MRMRFRSNYVVILFSILLIVTSFLFSLLTSGMTKTDISNKNDISTVFVQIEDMFKLIENMNLTHKERSSALISVKTILFRHMDAHKNINSSMDTELEKIIRNLDQFGLQLLATINDKLGSDSNINTDLSPPTMFNYLPHLLVNMEALNASLKLSKGRNKASLVMGIPTISRMSTSYLEQTLTSLVTSLSEVEQKECLIVVFIAEGYSNTSVYINSTISMITKSFPKQLESGLIDVIVPNSNFYPNLDNLKLTLGDKEDRVRWRVKQILDYSYLMMYCQSRGSLYLQLEDDIITNPSFYESIKTYVTSIQHKDWILIEFSKLGFIGKLFKSRDLPWIVEFFLSFYESKPVDWLLDNIFSVKYCSHGMTTKACETFVRANYRFRRTPSLFQHTGLHSSLQGKLQKLKDESFVVPKFINPAAVISTSMVTYKQYKLDQMYVGINYFWGIMPVKNDFISIVFNKPVQLTSYIISTGLNNLPSEIFTNATVYIQPVNPIKDLKSNDEGLYKIGELLKSDKGVFKGTIDEKYGYLKQMKIVVEEGSQYWVIVNKIQLFELKK